MHYSGQMQIQKVRMMPFLIEYVNLEFKLLGSHVMKNKMFILLVLLFGVLVACSEMKSHPMDMSQAVQSASTKADHEALAKHYDEAADEMQAKVDEHKKLLAEYHAQSYKYGRQGPTFEQHCETLIRAYENAVAENRAMAEAHRTMVAE